MLYIVGALQLTHSDPVMFECSRYTTFTFVRKLECCFFLHTIHLISLLASLTEASQSTQWGSQRRVSIFTGNCSCLSEILSQNVTNLYETLFHMDPLVKPAILSHFFIVTGYLDKLPLASSPLDGGLVQDEGGA